MNNKTYNGWSNYETWACKLWIDNDQGSSEYWMERAQEAWDYATASNYRTKREDAQYTLAEELRNYFSESMPELGASMWADLMNASFSEIDWHEIAESILTDDVEMDDGDESLEAKEA